MNANERLEALRKAFAERRTGELLTLRAVEPTARTSNLDAWLQSNQQRSDRGSLDPKRIARIYDHYHSKYTLGMLKWMEDQNHE